MLSMVHVRSNCCCPSVFTVMGTYLMFCQGDDVFTNGGLEVGGL